MIRNQSIFIDYINRKITGMTDSDLEKKYGIRINTIKRIVKKYLDSEASLKEKDLYSKRILLNNISVDAEVLKKIYNFFNGNYWLPDRNDHFFKESEYSYDTLRKYAFIYAINYLNVSKEKLKVIIEDAKVQRSRMISLAFSEKFVTDYINSNKTKKQYCLDNGISISTFNYHIRAIRNVNKKLYNECVRKIDYMNNYVSEDVLEKTIKLINYVVNGIEDSKGVREFDIIDYHLLIDVDLSMIVIALNTLYNSKIINIETYRIIKKDLTKFGYNNCANEFDNSSLVVFNNQELANELMEYKELNCLRDKNGLPIKGTGRVIEYKEKIKVLKFLKDKNIVVNGKTFDAGCMRIANGYMISDEKRLEYK